jgi:hypothetical protein
MEELVQFLQSSAQDIEGVQMVPLSVAIQAVQTVSSISLLDSVDKVTADILQSLNESQDTEE